MKKRHQQKLVILSIALLILFNAPVLLLFNDPTSEFGLPLIYGYLFLVWSASCVSSFLIFKKYNE